MARLRRFLAGLAVLAAVLPAAPAAGQERALVLETIEIEGAFRTARATVLHYLPLEEGGAVRPGELLDAVEDLRAAEIFSSVDFRTARGSERGKFVLTLVVKEKGLELRFGTGYRDLDGWYLIPAQLRLDNRLGRGERLRVQLNLGYRTFGLEALFADPRAGDGRSFWETKAGGYAVDRPYFVDGTEYRHTVGRGEFGVHAGRRFGNLGFQAGARFEHVDPDSTPTAAEQDDFRQIKRDDPLPFEDLPPEIADHVGENRRTVAHVQLVLDSRSRRRLGSTPVSGVWGRVRAETFLQEGADVGSVTADVRAYRRFLGGALALRLRGGAVGEAAAFYDRIHLGGLYTVRGFPSQALSPPGGDTRFWTGTLEFRAPMSGPPARPRLLGVVFVDAGDAWRESGTGVEGTAASAGWGLRVRVPWFDSLGVDFGLPVTDSPVGESWHANAAIGWNF